MGNSKKNPNWGGTRAGAGRPPIPEENKRLKHNIYCTAVELKKVKDFLAEIRAGNNDEPKDVSNLAK